MDLERAAFLLRPQSTMQVTKCPAHRGTEDILGQGPFKGPAVTPQRHSLIYKEASCRKVTLKTAEWEGSREDGNGLPLTFVTAVNRRSEIVLSIKKWPQTKELARFTTAVTSPDLGG